MRINEGPGRPSAFTPELGARICRMVQSCGFIAVASERCGIHRATVQRWKSRGENGDPEFAEFAQQLADARAQWATEQLQRVDDPRWLLERADREQFRLPTRNELTGADGAPLPQTVAVLTPEAAEQIRRKVLYGEDGDD